MSLFKQSGKKNELLFCYWPSLGLFILANYANDFYTAWELSYTAGLTAKRKDIKINHLA